MTDYKIRAATKDDSPQIIRLVKELAEYEKLEDQMKLSSEELTDDGFGDETFYKWLVAEIKEKDGYLLVGYALYFNTYSTFEGRSIYMEDIFVSEAYRGRGIGTALWKAVTKEAVNKRCKRLNFAVLNWNQKSIDFYNKKGCVDLTVKEAWHFFRMSHKDMIQFVNS